MHRGRPPLALEGSTLGAGVNHAAAHFPVSFTYGYSRNPAAQESVMMATGKIDREDARQIIRRSVASLGRGGEEKSCRKAKNTEKQL